MTAVRLAVGRMVTLTADEVKRFARSVGDDNALHHDEAAARASPDGQFIAGGAQTSSLLMAAAAHHFVAGHRGASGGRTWRRELTPDKKRLLHGAHMDRVAIGKSNSRSLFEGVHVRRIQP